MKTAPDPMIFVVPGDLHLTKAGLENHRVATWMVGEVNEMIRPDFVQFIGDNVQDATENKFRLFDDLRGCLAVPHHSLVGDHDVKGDPEARGFRAHLGETSGSTPLGGFRFLRLDTQQARPLGLSPGQIDWFRAKMAAAVAAGERVVIFQHNYPYQIWEDFAGPSIDEWRAIVQAGPVQAIARGHTHYGQIANDGRNVSIATRSIGDPEGGPPGYTIGYVHGEDLAFIYRSVEAHGPIALVTHPREALLAAGPRHVVTGPDQFRVRTWSASPITVVRGRLDGGPWFTLGSRNAGERSAPLPGDELAKGEHSFEVEAEDLQGSRARQSVAFMVDPTGRYTAVPTVRPRVLQTLFC